MWVKREESSMNVLVLLYKDVYNIPTRHIVDVLLNEGNYVEIYAKYMDNIHISF